MIDVKIGGEVLKKFIFISALIVSLSLTLLTTNIFASEIKYNIKSFDESSLIQSDGSYWVWGNNQTVPIQIHKRGKYIFYQETVK